MTKEIELTQGQVALVDDDMYEELNKYKWQVDKGGCKNSKYYAGRCAIVNGIKCRVSMHRQILGLVHYDGKITDHINRDTLDNRSNNLRVASYTINNRNTKLFITNTSGHKGVSWDKTRNKWMAHITVKDRQINLGRYEVIDEAIEARSRGEERYW